MTAKTAVWASGRNLGEGDAPLVDPRGATRGHHHHRDSSCHPEICWPLCLPHLPQQSSHQGLVRGLARKRPERERELGGSDPLWVLTQTGRSQRSGGSLGPPKNPGRRKVRLHSPTPHSLNKNCACKGLPLGLMRVSRSTKGCHKEVLHLGACKEHVSTKFAAP